MKNCASILFSLMTFAFVTIFASASAMAKEPQLRGQNLTVKVFTSDLATEGPALSAQVFNCDSNGDNCVPSEFVVGRTAKRSALQQTAEAIMDEVIAKAEAERSLSILLAAANSHSDRNDRSLDYPVQSTVATR